MVENTLKAKHVKTIKNLRKKEGENQGITGHPHNSIITCLSWLLLDPPGLWPSQRRRRDRGALMTLFAKSSLMNPASKRIPQWIVTWAAHQFTIGMRFTISWNYADHDKKKRDIQRGLLNHPLLHRISITTFSWPPSITFCPTIYIHSEVYLAISC